MNEFLAWISRIVDSWKFWIVVAPWEIGVRVRLGKRATALMPGVHLRVPFVDVITLVNTRLRIDGAPSVTVNGKIAGRTHYISASVGYRVTDPLKAMLMFGLPSSAVLAKAQADVATTRNEQETLDSLRSYFGNTGIEIDFIRFVEDVEVRTFRLLQGYGGTPSGHESTNMNGSPSARY